MGGEDGSVRIEPIAADVRPNKDGKRSALLKLVAGILGLGLDVLKLRDQERRMRRMMLVGAAMAILGGVFAILAIYANQQRQVAEERRRLAVARPLSTPSEAVSHGAAWGSRVVGNGCLQRDFLRFHREILGQRRFRD